MAEIAKNTKFGDNEKSIIARNRLGFFGSRNLADGGTVRAGEGKYRVRWADFRDIVSERVFVFSLA